MREKCELCDENESEYVIQLKSKIELDVCDGCCLKLDKIFIEFIKVDGRNFNVEMINKLKRD